MTDEMKPVRCGCGGSPIIRNERGQAVYVQCVSCGTRSIETNRTEAITAWNRAMGSHTTACTTEDGVYTSDCTITNTSSPNEDFHPVRDCMVGAERTAMVWKPAKGRPVYEKGICSCGYVLSVLQRDYVYCPMCGCRLEWE